MSECTNNSKTDRNSWIKRSIFCYYWGKIASYLKRESNEDYLKKKTKLV